MTGFELQTSGIGSDRSTNLATTTARNGIFKKNYTKNFRKRQN